MNLGKWFATGFVVVSLAVWIVALFETLFTQYWPPTWQDVSVFLTIFFLSILFAFYLLHRIGIFDVFGSKPFGNAKWARPWQLWWHGLTKKGGLFLGQSWGSDLYHNDEGHILTIGGAGGGKSTGLVVPALMELTQGSVIVTDPKGELAAMTRRHREKIGPVIMLNPFHEVFRSGTGLDYPDTGFNPLSIIDPSLSTFKSDCDELARYLMVTDRKESGSYFSDEGAEFLSLVIAATILDEPADLHTLPFVYRRIRDDVDTLKAWFEHVAKQGHPALADEATRYLGILEKSPNQWDGIASKAALATKRYAPSTPLGEHVSKNGFNLADLKKKTLTIYILVPTGQLATALPWMNTIMGIFGMAVGRPGPARPVTLLIDEAPALGYLPDLQNFLALFRGAGLRVWIFTQTAAMLSTDELYGQTGFKAIAGLCSIKQFFSIREKEVAQMVSDLCGQRSAKNLRQGQGGDSETEVGVPLIRPEKVRGLRKWQQIIVIDAMADPIKGWLVPYFKRHKWRRMTDPNPYRRKK